MNHFSSLTFYHNCGNIVTVNCKVWKLCERSLRKKNELTTKKRLIMKRCPKGCRDWRPNSENYCRDCGAKLILVQTFQCNQCGAEHVMQDFNKHCVTCGQILKPPQSTKKPREKIPETVPCENRWWKQCLEFLR
jgi:hypothetical protein